MENSVLSLIPPVLAIAMVMVTRKVLLSLGTGIIVGLLLLNHFNPMDSLVQLYKIVKGIFIADGGVNTDQVYILIFPILLGMLASMVTLAGGSRAFGDWAVKRIKTRRGAQFLPALLGIVIFIDDYFNALTVGNVSRPVTDRYRISRAKLAYMIDSTSAPVCVLMPVSSWGAYIISILAGLFAAHHYHAYGSLQAFLMMIPMNYYAIIALLMILSVAFFNVDFGLMRKHEERAVRTGKLTDPDKGTAPGDQGELPANENGRVHDLIWPIIILVAATVFFMLYTGAQATKGEVTLLASFKNTDVATSLLYGGIIGLLSSLVFVWARKTSLKDTRKGLWAGIKAMMPAIYILIFAWTIIEVINGLGTGKYLAGLVNGHIPLALLPMLLFLIAAFMSFCTGTSWGTFGIMLPIAAQIVATADMNLMLPVLASVLAGAIFGDHCSPISDTTIMSSTGSGVHHIDHVMTQIPYAVTIALISAVGYLVLGLTGSSMLGLLAALILLGGTIAVLKTRPSVPNEVNLGSIEK